MTDPRPRPSSPRRRSRLLGLTIVGGALAVVTVVASLGLGQKLLPDAPPTAAPSASGSPGEVATGWRGRAYGGAVAPTGERPQSKLWYHDGVWWAVMFDQLSTDHRIHRLDPATEAWQDTGMLVDERITSAADVLWDGTHLHVVSGGPHEDDPTHGARVLRYRYDAATRSYQPDLVPVVVSPGGSESLVLDADDTGRVWVTYTRGRAVYVTHNEADDPSRWAPAYILPAREATGLDADDEAALVAYDGAIGVMWSHGGDDAFYFASHADGDPDRTWTVTSPLHAPKFANDHLSLVALQDDPAGHVVAAVKTARSAEADPLVLLMVLRRDGQWSRHLYGTVEDEHTRPLVVVNGESRRLYVFATTPCCAGGSIVYKETSLDAIVFPPGRGTPFLDLPTDRNLNNAAASKRPVTDASGILVAAGDDRTRHYAYNRIPGTPPGTPETRIGSGPAPLVTSASASIAFASPAPDATFECSADGGPFTACASPVELSRLTDGAHTFAVRAVSPVGAADPTPATRHWLVSTPGRPVLADGFESGLSRWMLETRRHSSIAIREGIATEGTRAAELRSERRNIAHARTTLPVSLLTATVALDVRLVDQGPGMLPLLRLLGSDGRPLASVLVAEDGRIHVAYGEETHATAGFLPRAGWSRLDLRFVAAGHGRGVLAVSSDGQPIYRIGSLPLSEPVTRIQIGSDEGVDMDLLVDDVRVVT